MTISRADHDYEMWTDRKEWGWVCFQCNGEHHGGFTNLTDAEFAARLEHDFDG